MNSPFPGMDPYLEQHWLDVHQRLIIYSSDQLQVQLPGDLRACVEERVYVEPDELDEVREISPDVRVVEHGPAQTASRTAELAATTEPLLVSLLDEPITEGYIEIIDASTGNRIVTIIEFLSPTNKLAGDGRDQYLQKQREIRKSRVNLVEIDLTRRGRRQLLVPSARIPRKGRTTYQACVRRAAKPSHAEVYAMPLQAPLPTIAIPLRKSDSDVSLNLQALIEQCYRNGRYDDLDYKVPPSPPLNEFDAQWADEWLRGQGRR